MFFLTKKNRFYLKAFYYNYTLNTVLLVFLSFNNQALYFLCENNDLLYFTRYFTTIAFLLDRTCNSQIIIFVVINGVGF